MPAISAMPSSAVFQFFGLTLAFVFCVPFPVRHSFGEDDDLEPDFDDLEPYFDDLEPDSDDLEPDFPEINTAAGLNLFEGDIVLPRGRSALKDEKYRWKLPIPFILHNNLDLNAKGVILKVFEGFSLKTCIQFKPYEGESSYLIFQKLKGCSSTVGNVHKVQNVSIGAKCDRKGIVTHEILHALGLYHEQARIDRDDYIKIWWDHILPGKTINYQKYTSRARSHGTDLNTPYDYESIMHYGRNSFSKNKSLPTITANVHKFDGIIGQRLDFSSSDIKRINQMYNCTRSLTLLDQCDFESADICGLVQERRDDADWVHKKSNSGDHSLRGKCEDGGYFMFFNTSIGKAGKTAILKSRILRPRRMQQCLQFFFKMTGSPKDKLVIWAQRDDGSGTVRSLVKLQTLQGGSEKNWKIAHVPLKGQKKFRYLFQGKNGGSKTSAGGILIDDITLTETLCPNAVWHVDNISQLLDTAALNYTLKSPGFYSPEGYAYGLALSPRVLVGKKSKKYIEISFHLTSGEHDGALEWPAINRQATITVLDQDADVMKRMSIEKSFTTLETHAVKGKNVSKWENPSIFGKFDPECKCKRGKSWALKKFATHEKLRRKNYFKNDVLIILVDFEDITYLKDSEAHILEAWNMNHDLPLAQRKRLAHRVTRTIPK